MDNKEILLTALIEEENKRIKDKISDSQSVVKLISDNKIELNGIFTTQDLRNLTWEMVVVGATKRRIIGYSREDRDGDCK